MKTVACDGHVLAVLLLQLVVAASLVGAQQQGTSAVASENVTCSPPDIYPPNGTFTGEVEVRFVANQPEATIYWVKTELSPERPTGDVPTNASRVYSGPFTIFDPGMWQVSAIAIPTKVGVLLDSPVASRTYRVLKPEISIPIVSPPRGRYRGVVSITLTAAESIMARPGAKIQYVVDVDDPGNTWQTYVEPFLLDTPGDHVVKCRVIVNGSEAGEKKMSPIAKYRYYLRPPLVYDVTTECEKCSGLPTLGKRFTVWLQSAEVNSLLFLTTSSKGCEMNRHILDDTDYVTVRARQVSYRFVTYTEPQPRVYVCLKEPSNVNATFVVVPKRIKANAQGVSEAFFSVEPAFGAVRRQATEAPPASAVNPFSEKGSFSISFVILFCALVIAIVATCATMGRMVRGRQFAHSNHRNRTGATISTGVAAEEANEM